MMTLAIIAAVSENGVIGRQNQLPWQRLKRDMQHFKQLTVGHTVIMGRHTFESIGRALPHRRNIVVTRSSIDVPDVQAVRSIDAALALTKKEDQVFVIGGRRLYEAALPRAEKFYLTQVMAVLEGDVYFPKWDPKDWQMIAEQSADADQDNDYPVVFITYIRRPC
jgi:dihydrofolate reductase